MHAAHLRPIQTCFALADCNNFYASCEAVFCPDLAGRPVVVAGNNDGNVIARSREAKALGIPMGAPLYQLRELIAATASPSAPATSRSTAT